jgi:hypothetical protein
MDTKKQEIPDKIVKLLKLASSTTFPGEAESAKKIAYSLAEKNNLKIQEKDGEIVVINPDDSAIKGENLNKKSKPMPDKPSRGIYTIDPKTGERVYGNGYREMDRQTYQKDLNERKRAEETLKRYYEKGEI